MSSDPCPVAFIKLNSNINSTNMPRRIFLICHAALKLVHAFSLFLQSASNRLYLTGSVLILFLLFEKVNRESTIKCKPHNMQLATTSYKPASWKRRGELSSSVLCLLFYHDVRLVRSKLFYPQLSLQRSPLKRCCFQWLHWTLLSPFWSILCIHLIIQCSSNSPQTCIIYMSSAPMSTPFRAWYHGLGAVKVSAQ